MPTHRSDAVTQQRRLVGKLRRLGSGGLRQFERSMRETARKNALTYTLDDGRTIVMPLLAAPALLSSTDVAYLHRLCKVLLSVFRKTAEARRDGDPRLHELLPLSAEEQEWLALAPQRMGPLIGRFDLNVNPARGGARTATLLELNGCAIGGIHYGPATSQTLLTHVSALADGRAPRMPAAMSDIWLDLCHRHARSLGRSGLRVLWLENHDWEAGITEGPTLVEHARRSGHAAQLADPRDLSLRKDDIYAGGKPVDIVYRSMDVRDLIEIEAEEGRPLRAMREAVRRGRVLSPMQGDLDHKSLLEVWSSRRFASLFSAVERAALRRHVPWTRLLGDRRSEDPDGARIDLPAFTQRARARLVIKPTRSCGGEGILIGPDTTASRWQRAIDRAVTGKEPAVVQQLVRGATLGSPCVRGGRVVVDRHFTNFGLLASPDRVGILGRAAPFPVVNVSRGGGVLGVLLV
jgi:hypothetical protein